MSLRIFSAILAKEEPQSPSPHSESNLFNKSVYLIRSNEICFKIASNNILGETAKPSYKHLYDNFDILPMLSMYVSAGSNPKAKLATRCLFSLAHKHGDILREGWKNVLEILLQLFRCELLPKSLMEGEDYVDAAGR